MARYATAVDVVVLFGSGSIVVDDVFVAVVIVVVVAVVVAVHVSSHDSVLAPGCLFCS